MMKKWTRYMLLMPVLLVQALSSCSLIDEPEGSSDMTASLAFNVSVNRAGTRMSDEVTQQLGTPFRDIRDLMLLPFDVSGTIGADATPLSGMEYNMEQNNEVKTNYFDNHTVKIPERTASFLCYAKASVSEGADPFVYGSIAATGLTGATPNTSTISFAPKVIHNNVNVEANAQKIADYLTGIANAKPEGGTDTWSTISQNNAKQFEPLTDLRTLFRQFVNEGHVIACSSDYTLGLVNDLYTRVNALVVEAGSDEAKMKAAILAAIKKGVTFDETTSKVTALGSDMSGYPASIFLPDGVAVMKWNNTNKVFDIQVETTTSASVNSLNRFIYPAELWYYANSRIKTSVSSQIENFDKSWDVVLAGYETDNGVMDGSVHSVAIKDPLSYAVGCLQVGLVVNNTLTDADEEHPTTIDNLSSGTFPLTAVFVSGQHAQAFNFTPKDDIYEYIIYDKEISGITMGDAKTSTPSSATPTKYTNTLVFQSQDGKNVRFALEFLNNSNYDFWGVNGKVFKGTKFYLVGDINVPESQTVDYKRRAFTKDYTTQGTVTISSLKQAYTYLPDLLDPRLEIGIQLVPKWIQATTTNVAL